MDDPLRSRDNMPQVTPTPKQQRTMNYEFNADEMRVIRECNYESFFERSLPIGTLMGVSTFYGVKAGYLSANPRWGSTPKVMLAVTLGYFLGKLSYQNKCAEKLMQLPNSKLGQLLRQRRLGGGAKETSESTFGASVPLNPFSSFSSTESYNDIDVNESRGSDIDTYRPLSEGLDDPHVYLDPPTFEDELPPKQNTVTSYEDLRRQNRQEYLDSKSRQMGRPMVAPDNQPPSQQTPPPAERLPAPRMKNKYGDTFE